MNETQNRIALITGSSRGIGRSEAIALARSGCDVIITYRTGEQEAKAVIDEITAMGRRAKALQLDVGDARSFDGFVSHLRTVLADEWGRADIDILVNNAGAAVWTPLGEINVDEVRAALDVHVVGVVMLTQALARHIADGGRIINTSSGLARFVGENGYSVYAAAKGAIVVWTRYLAQELASRGITVNAIAPGATGTDFGGGSLRDNDDIRSALGAVTAMGHVGRPEDVGAAVAVIASEGMSWVTGQRIEASGGMRL
ncbi:SDR family NAD(P)-dependent oxidoreductase [Paramicrobacterium agarici]|uniref:SDR family NAD(P)-dependent oxidoreductase n=1 Tax=Paramicrobacterium agarici TaxID=630514 RepID=UPI0011526511|nr:SDR family oxidoreductase [Microbacterium agarici]TQO23319.1 NAD(P)-dependent dehydrogenase (short-subunit alcohol dehydrogenase family) [Microbacterium agarici]